ncbi:MAG: hypothetical protein KBT11_08605 [Treponema sp.]|nr:hypothetical protein [Candidatus Treponema equifaecale]
MLQFYFLSILLNVVTGFVFLYASEENSENGIASLPILSDKTFRLVLGILMALTGLLKLLSPIQYDIAFIGDLIPALAGLAGGASLLVEWYEEKSSVSLPLPEIIQTAFVEGRKYLGIFCIASGVLHFVFPRVLFL